jgi:hypothetical protein
MWTEGETEMTKLIVTFSNFVNAPKHEKCTHCIQLATAPSIFHNIYCNIDLQYIDQISEVISEVI